MKNHFSRTLGVFAVMLTGATLAFGQAVLAPAKRQQSLDRGKAMVAPREVTPVVADPFYSTAFTEAVAAMGRVSGPAATTPATGGNTEPARQPAGPRTDRELLEAIAKTLTPSGSFVIGGEPLLTFGQKRVKAGGVLTITFEGSQYTLEVVSITRTNFTLRLNREEFTRTIK